MSEQVVADMLTDHDDEHEEDAAEEFWEETHELFVNISLALLILHFLGVLASSWRHRENLPRSMLDGRKRVDAKQPEK